MSSLFSILQIALDVPVETALLALCKLAAAFVAFRVVISREPQPRNGRHPGIICPTSRGPDPFHVLQELTS